ncbi:MAG TPA: TRAP transporter substrate-binding protein [Steroidobacteraceae bacterium]|nr:TRAP transporter substrate-binding protein [Steroidobacteraceae bacterium]
MSILTPRRCTAACNPDLSSPGLRATRSTTTISRRGMMLRGGAIAGAAATFPAPAISQGIREFKMATSWPKGTPGLDSSAKRIGQAITAGTGKRIQVSVFAAGELVKPFEVFDAVSSGVVDMYHSGEYYWERRSPAFNFFAAVPFGFTADELAAWIHFGGGQELWDELSANYNIKPLLSTNTGVQMGGWFTKEVTGPESYVGLKYRMPGLGGEVLRRLGAVVVTSGAEEIVPALRSGAIDASEWVGPWNDMHLGLNKVSKFYYYPGFHEPGTGFATGINKARWDSLTTEDRNIISTVVNGEYTYSLAEFNTNNAKSLQKLSQDKNIEIRKFDDSLLQALGKASGEVMAEVGNKDPLTRRVYQSYIEFRVRCTPWSDIAERAYLNARSLPFPYGGRG